MNRPCVLERKGLLAGLVSTAVETAAPCVPGIGGFGTRRESTHDARR